ncbi:unnamed protein product [Phytomonas sp. Hart1]|nr:unnamed protein product [Phytomonas sp. Hart1]|eukprot:CCW66160.1 unnamed protein product [Phytomonas sp. isolate Hart1]
MIPIVVATIVIRIFINRVGVAFRRAVFRKVRLLIAGQVFRRDGIRPAIFHNLNQKGITEEYFAKLLVKPQLLKGLLSLLVKPLAVVVHRGDRLIRSFWR